MELVIYYRPSLFGEEEYEAASKAGFKLTSLISDLRPNQVVIPRYTTLPFVEDVYAEFENIGCHVVNSLRQHKVMADIFTWVKILRELTPKTYGQYDMVNLPEGAYVLKGATNSKKSYWNTHMFAPTKKDVSRIFANLVDDSLIGNQEIAIREFIPLRTLGEGINGLPISREFRYFFLGDKLVAKGFYWQNYVDDVDQQLVKHREFYSYKQFINKVSFRLSQYLNFYCVDVAQTEKGDWIVIEVNDGTMAGLSCIDPEEFYARLFQLGQTYLNFT